MAVPVYLYPVLGFFAGSIPFSYLAGRLLGGKDVRREGSGNVGATNVFRVAGKKAGIAAAVGDVLKSLLPLLAARGAGIPPAWLALTAGAVILGHCYSPFLRFRGGKGVISAVSVIVVIFFPAALVFGVVWLICFQCTGFVSLASILGAASLPLTTAILGASRPTIVLAISVFLFVSWKHRENVRRLIAGTESRMKKERNRL